MKKLVWGTFVGVAIVVTLMIIVAMGAGSGADSSPSSPPPGRPPAAVAASLSPAARAELAESYRIRWAKDFDKIMLDGGIESTTSASGPRHTTLTVECALAGRVMENQLAESGIPDTAKSLGFRKLVLTDGFDTQFVWDLTK